MWTVLILWSQHLNCNESQVSAVFVSLCVCLCVFVSLCVCLCVFASSSPMPERGRGGKIRVCVSECLYLKKFYLFFYVLGLIKQKNLLIVINLTRQYLLKNFLKFLIKVIVLWKKKIHSLSTHHYADGGWVKCFSPLNTSGVSGVNNVTAKFNTIEVNGDSFRLQSSLCLDSVLT